MRKPDVFVIGAGIFGLSVAWVARQRGLSVTVVDRAAPGAGASGGIVGALSPHVPDQWNPKKQFQLDALMAAPRFWADVAAAGGGDPGYARLGRLLPLRTAAARDLAIARASAATAVWGAAARWRVVDQVDPGWLAPPPFGAVHETLSARLDPRAACAALAAALVAEGADILTETAVHMVEPGLAQTEAGPLRGDRIVIAAGLPGFALARLAGAGSGVKGQAARLRVAAPRDAPLIFDDGIYIVPHGDGTVAVGSTSERRYASATAVDGALDEVLEAARALCPALAAAPVMERWAGVRPKARRRDPMLGAVPGMPGVWVALGGFKIGFGLAPVIGGALVDLITGADPALPESFTVAHHLAGLAEG